MGDASERRTGAERRGAATKGRLAAGDASPLLRRFPDLRTIPRVDCALLPTPVEEAPELARAIGLRRALWIKRDDLSGRLYGGNKIRKLRFLLGQARAGGKRRLITAGAIGSHHSLATTLYGIEAGFEVEAALFPQPATEHVRANLAANLAAGLRPLPIPSPLLVPFALVRRRHDPRYLVIPGGGSSARGVIGYVEAAFELADQVAAGLLPAPALVVVALGTGGTAAGLALGLRLANLPTRLLAVRVIDRIIGNGRTIGRLAKAAQRELQRFDPTFPLVRIANFRVDHQQFGHGYGHPTPAAETALQLAANHGGIGLETTYTAKALAALVQRARAGGADLPDGPVLFWNTFSSVRPPGYDPAAREVRHLLPEAWQHHFQQ
jgi:1-aminocyclopropane-1-carboxylate deaminase/D-cysteine desulfhydrase-like pyridoxal-dependent ACC family enzyme